MSRRTRSSLVIALLVACRGDADGSVAPVAEPLVPAPGEPAVPLAALEPAPALPSEQAPDPNDIPDRTARLGPDDILLQLDYEVTFGVAQVVHLGFAFGTMPIVTLYRDGTTIAVTDQGAMWWHRDESATIGELDRVRALGIAKIRDHRGSCNAKGECVTDAALVHVRWRRVDGQLGDLVSYAGFSNRHQKKLDAIYDRLDILATPPPAALPWVPANASLFLRSDDDLDPLDRENVALAAAWPLAPELFERAVHEGWIVVAVDRPQILKLVGRVGTTGAAATFRVGDRVVHAALVPWLPGVDHHEAIARAELRE